MIASAALFKAALDDLACADERVLSEGGRGVAAATLCQGIVEAEWIAETFGLDERVARDPIAGRGAITAARR